MRILGIDPGYARCGYAVLEGNVGTPHLVTAGVITTDKRLDLPVRLFEIRNDITALIERYKPQVLSIEGLHFVQSVTTGLKVAQVRGVIICEAAAAQMIIREPKPTAVKAAFTGDGSADKTAMKHMVEHMFGADKKALLDDAADAIAVAWWAMQNGRFMV